MTGAPLAGAGFFTRLRRPLAKRLRAFPRRAEGATAVEFALVGGPFLALVLAIFETAFVSLAAQGVEAAVGEVGRMVMTGQAQSATSAVSFRDQFICNPPAPRHRVLPSFVDCSKLIVDVRTPAGFASADLTRGFISAGGSYCPGGANAIVVVRVVYPMPVYLPLLSLTGAFVTGTSTAGLESYGGGLKHMIMAASAFRNEAFTTTPTSGGGC